MSCMWGICVSWNTSCVASLQCCLHAFFSLTYFTVSMYALSLSLSLSVIGDRVRQWATGPWPSAMMPRTQRHDGRFSFFLCSLCAFLMSLPFLVLCSSLHLAHPPLPLPIRSSFLPPYDMCMCPKRRPADIRSLLLPSCYRPLPLPHVHAHVHAYAHAHMLCPP